MTINSAQQLKIRILALIAGFPIAAGLLLGGLSLTFAAQTQGLVALGFLLTICSFPVLIASATLLVRPGAITFYEPKLILILGAAVVGGVLLFAGLGVAVVGHL